MRTIPMIVGVLLLSGCATEMVTQCAMKSVSNDPWFAASCGAAMAATAVVVGVGVAHGVAEKLKQQSDSFETPDSNPELNIRNED